MRLTRDEIAELQSMISIVNDAVRARKKELIEAVAGEA
jgi:hypothetical protein